MNARWQAAQRRWWFAAIAASLVVVPGCIEGERSRFVRYDADTDKFRVLTVCSHICTDKSEELEYLLALWNLRSHILIGSDAFIFGGLAGYVRRSDSEYLDINLGERTTGKLQPQRTEISLDSIEIKPGQFFLSRANTLAYYHEISIPGKTLDTLLKQFAKPLNKFVIDQVNQEIKRRNSGGATVSWEDAQKAAITQLSSDAKEDGATKTQRKDLPGPIAYLSDDSLRLLLKQATGEEIAINRHGTKFQLVLPLSQTDCQQAKSIIEALRPELIRKLGESQGMPKTALSCVSSLDAQHDDGRGLVISIDIGSRVALGAIIEPGLGPNVEKRRAACTNTVALVRGRGIPVNDTLRFEAIVKAFAGGDF